MTFRHSEAKMEDRGFTSRAQLRKARRTILEKANRQRSTLGVGNLDPYRMRHLHRAVRTCRQFRLVPARTLRAAGFNA